MVSEITTKSYNETNDNNFFSPIMQPLIFAHVKVNLYALRRTYKHAQHYVGTKGKPLTLHNKRAQVGYQNQSSFGRAFKNFLAIHH